MAINEQDAFQVFNAYKANLIPDELKPKAKQMLDDYRSQQVQRMQSVFSDLKTLDAEDGSFITADRFSPGAGDKLRKKEANILWLSNRYNAPETDVRKRYDLYKAEAATEWGQAGIDDESFFSRASQEVGKQKKQIQLIQSAQEAAFLSAVNGGDDVADFSAWQFANPDPESFTGTARSAWEDERKRTLNRLGPDGQGLAARVVRSLRHETGVAREEDAWLNQTVEMLTQLKATDPDKYNLVMAVANAKAQKAEKPEKGIAEGAVEAFGRSSADIIAGIPRMLVTTAGEGSAMLAEAGITTAENPELLAKRIRARSEIQADLQDLARGVIDPIESRRKGWAKYAEDAVYMFAGSAPTMVAPLIPGGQAALTGMFANESYEDFRRAGWDGPGALGAALATGRIQAAIERVSESAMAIPGVASWMAKYGAKPGMSFVKTFLARTAARSGVEFGEEFAQQVIGPAAQELGSAIISSIPDRPEGMKFRDVVTEFAAAENSIPLLLSVLPLGALGAGMSTQNDMVLVATITRDPRLLRAVMSEAEAKKIEQEANPQVRAEMIKKAWQAAPTSDIVARIKALVQDDAKRVEEAKNVLAEAEKTGLIPRIRRDAEGWKVEQNGQMVRVDSREAAVQMAYSSLDDLERQQYESMALVADELLNDQEAMEISGSQQTLKGLVDAKLITPQEAAKRAQLAAQMAGMTQEEAQNASWIVLGKNTIEQINNVRTAVSRIYRGANVITQIHEHAHGRWATALNQGYLTHDDGVQFVRLAEQATGLQFLPVADDSKVSPQMLDEAIVEVVSADTVGRRKTDKRFTPGVISRGIAAFIKNEKKKQLGERVAGKMAERGLTRFKAFMSSYREFWGVVLRNARALKKARDEGKIGEDFDTFLEALLGTDTQTRVEAEAIQEVGQMIEEVDNQPFSLSRATPADTSKIVQMPDGAQLVGPTSFSIRAYHGTPHKVDKFTTAKIGTGEGAQAYGWGLYFAESREVAEGYAVSTVTAAPILWDGEPYNPQNPAHVAGMRLRVSKGDRAAAIAKLESLNPDAAKVLRDGNEAKPREKGNLYTVELLPDSDEFLDWDKPLSEQSEKVLDLLANVAESPKDIERAIASKQGQVGQQGRRAGMAEAEIEKLRTRLANVNVLTGAEFYKRLSAESGGDSGASQKLASAKIPGIRYLDGGSRGAGDGTRNYVIFDENLVKILEENGKPVEETSFSLAPSRTAQDAEYMAAVAAGDMAKAQRMVDEAAKAAGVHPKQIKDLQEIAALWNGAQRTTGMSSGQLWRKAYGLESRGNYGLDGYVYVSFQRPATDVVMGLDKAKAVDENTWGFIATQKPLSVEQIKSKRLAPIDKALNAAVKDLVFSGLSIEIKNASGEYAELLWTKDPATNELRVTMVDKEGPWGHHTAEEVFSGDTWASPERWMDGTIYDSRLPSQIKSADPVTYDDAGNVIPLSQRFQPESPDIRFSLAPFRTAQDAEYLAAVESGDMEKAQRMVDEAAKAAGYLPHGDFRDSHKAPSNQLGTDDDVRNGDADASLVQVARGVHNQPDDYFDPRVGPRYYAYQDKAGMEAFKAIRSAMDKIQRRKKAVVTVYRAVPIDIKGTKLENRDWVTPSKTYAVNHGKSRFGEDKYRIIKESVPAENLFWDGNDIREWGKDDAQNYFYKNTANNIKSADPVTYDDAGNVIPLSQRFQPESPDIRFSLARATSLFEVADTILASRMRKPEFKEGFYIAARRRLERLAKQKNMQGQGARESQLGAIRTLNAILSAFSPAIRGEVVGGNMGFINLAELKTDAARAKEITRVLNKLEDILEREAKKYYTDKIDRMLERAQLKGKPGEVKKSDFIVTVQDELNLIQVAVDLDTEEVQAGITAAEAELMTADTPEKADSAMARMHLLETFGALFDEKNTTSAEMEVASDYLEQLMKQGREARRMLDEERRNKVKAYVEAASKDVFNGEIGPDTTQEARMKAAKKSGRTLLKKFFQEGLSYDLVLRYLFGADSKTAQEFGDRFILNSNAFEDTQNERRKRLRDFSRELYKTKLGARINQKLMALDTKQANTGVTYLKGREVVTHKMDLEQAAKVVADPKSFGFTAADAKAISAELDAINTKNADPTQRKVKRLVYEQTVKTGDRVEIPLSQMDALYLSMALRQPGILEQQERYGYDQKTVDELENFLTDEAKAWREWMQEEYDAEYDVANQVYMRLFNTRMPQIKFYAPLLKNHQGNQAALDPLNSGLVAQSANPGSIKSRKARTSSLRIESALDVFWSHFNQMDYWVHMAEYLRDVQSVMLNPTVRDAVVSKHGTEGMQTLNAWITLQLGRGVGKGALVVAGNRMIRNIKSAVSMKALALSLSTTLKTLPSMLYSLGEIHLSKWPAALASGMKHWSRLWNTNIIQRRLDIGGMPELRDLGNSALPMSWVNQGIKMGSYPTMYADGVFTTYSAAMAYGVSFDEAKAQGASDEMAHKHAEERTAIIVSKTAQPENWTQKSLLENDASGAGTLFYLFTSDPRQKAALTFEVFNRLRKGEASLEEASRKFLAYWVLPGIMFQLANAVGRSLFKGDDDEWDVVDFATAALVGQAQGFLLIGSSVEMIVSAAVAAAAEAITGEEVKGKPFWNSPKNPLDQAAQEMVKAAQTLNEDDGKAGLEKAWQLGKAASMGMSWMTPAGAIPSTAERVFKDTSNLFYSEED